MKPLHAFLLASLVALGTGGCGYQIGRPFDTDVESIAVEIVSRGPDVFRREIELRATEAIKKRIQHATPYVITSKGRADTLLVTRLEMVTQTPLTYNPDTGVPRQQEVTFRVSMTWTDQRTGTVRVHRDRLLAGGMYLRPAPFGQTFFVGREEALNELALRIVEELEDKQWPSPPDPQSPPTQARVSDVSRQR
jgi:hypothetical protein